MFHLIEVSGKTAFFERTGTAVFDPWGDSWWLQRSNGRLILRYMWLDKLKCAVPERWRAPLRDWLDRIRLRTGHTGSRE